MSVAVHSRSLLPAYARQDVTFVEGDGAWLVDSEGRRYLDLVAGIAVVGLGHGHPAPLAAAREQLERLWHVSNLYWTEPMVSLAERLSARFGGASAFFCNSGAEAVEAALKYARKASGRPAVVALEGSFHGRTMGALSVTGQPAKRDPFAPLVPGVRVRAAERRRVARGGGRSRHGLHPARADPGRGRSPRRGQDDFLAAARTHRRRARRAARPRRGADRRGADRARSSPTSSSASAPTRSRSPRASPTGFRSAASSSPTMRRRASSPATTRAPSAATRLPARRLAPSATRSTTSCWRRSASKAPSSLGGWPRCRGVVAVRGRGLLLAAELDRPAADVVASLPRARVCSSARQASRRCASRRR